MAVYVDYGEGSVLYEVEASESYTQPTADEVTARGTDVYGYLQDLEAAADSAASTALTKIEELANFNASVSTVTFDIPAIPTSSVDLACSVPDLSLIHPTVAAASLGTNFTYTTEDAVTQTWSAPAPVSFTAPEAPGASSSFPLPSAPSSYTFPNTTAPTLTPSVFAPDDLAVPSLEDITLDVSDVVFIEPLVVDTDTDALIDAINAMKSFDITPPTLPEYAYLIPEIFTVTGSMASGDCIVQYQQLLNSRAGLLAGTAPATYNSFSRRGLLPPDGAATYDTWLNNILSTKLDDSDTVFEAVAVDECVRTAFQVGTAAHRLLVDIETTLYGLDFSLAKAVVNAQLEQAKAITNIYKAELVLLQNTISQYNASAAYIVAQAKVFEANAQQVELIGDINTVTADMFAATESVKGVEADVYKSLVMGEKAKLTQYKAVVDGYKAAVAQATSAVAAYSGATTLYAAEVSRISSEYDTYATTAQSVQFNNAARAAAVQAEQAELRSYAAQADSLAASAAVKAIQLQADAAERSADRINKGLDSDEEAVRLRINGGKYDEQITKFVTEIQTKVPNVEGTSDYASIVTRYVAAVQDSVNRAAQLSQTANIQLAKAYADVYAAAGSAGAAVASGQLSGFRASASLSAGDSLDASNSYTVARSYSGANRYSENINYTSSI